MDADTRVSNYGQGRKNKPKALTQSLAVTNAVWLHDFVVTVFFNDNTKQDVDFGPYLLSHSHPYIDRFKEQDQFRTFYVDGGNLVWGDDWNMIFPTWKLHRGYLDV